MILNTDKTLIHTQFFRPGLAFNRPPIIQIHNIHDAISYIHQHIHPHKIFKIFCNCSISLRHNRTICNLNQITYLPVFHGNISFSCQIFFETVSLCLNPLQWKSHSKMNSCFRKTSRLNLLCNRCKSHNIGVIILLLIGNKTLMTFPNNIISTIILNILLGKHWLTVTLHDTCLKYPVGSLNISIAIINAQNNGSIYIVFSNLSHNKILSFSGICTGC